MAKRRITLRGVRPAWKRCPALPEKRRPRLTLVPASKEIRRCSGEIRSHHRFTAEFKAPRNDHLGDRRFDREVIRPRFSPLRDRHAGGREEIAREE